MLDRGPVMREFITSLLVGMVITAFLMLVVIPAAVAVEAPACVIKRDLDGRIHRSERVHRLERAQCKGVGDGD